MRIGIDYTAAVRQGAGIGRFCRGLLGALTALDHTNEYVVWSGGRAAVEPAWPANFRRVVLPLSDRQQAILWQRLRLPLPVELFTGRLDLYHSPDFVLPPVRRARTLLTVHDLSFMRHPECSSPALLAYLLDAVPRSVAQADLVLADSENTRRDVIELLGVPAERTRVVYAGLEAGFGRVDDAAVCQAALARYGITPPYILAVGTLQPRKNLARLIHALVLARERYGLPHQLVIAGGKGWLYDDILEAAQAAGDAVLLAGYVADADLPALYSAAELFAYPSLYEGCGLPILEAMACGTPVLTSTTSSMPEVAGDAALLVDPTDVEAIATGLWRLISDGALRETLVQRGYARLERFTWPGAARELLAAYEQCVAAGGHGHAIG
ncbi:MAG: glycosyltransferase family 1 protein [Anaerolineales bacterium]